MSNVYVRRRVGAAVAFVIAVTLVVWVAKLIANGADGLADGSSRTRVAQAPIASATNLRAPVLSVGGPLPTHPIAPGFLGFSIEFGALPKYVGTAQDPNPLFAQLVRGLNPGQRPSIRIGGDSTDWAWVPTTAVARPLGIRIDLGQSWLRSLGVLAQELRPRLILGLDLAANSTTLAAAEARAFAQAAGASNVEALEVGNEPELYSAFGWYTSPSGTPVLSRPAGYAMPDYIRDFNVFARALPGRPLAGPGVGAPKWMALLGQFLPAVPRLADVTVHRYPLQRCQIEPGTPAYPTIARLLSGRSTRRLANSVASDVRIAHAHGEPIRVDELNSVACHGAPGVSDRFAAALWALDTMFEMARVGVDGVNIHTLPNAAYQPFTFRRTATGWTERIKPEYYGLLMFANAAPPGSRLLRLNGPTQPGIWRWATKGRDCTTRVTLIAAGLAHPRMISIRSPGSSTQATIQWLRAPSLAAATGITLSATQATAHQATFRVRLAPGNAAIVEIPPAG